MKELVDVWKIISSGCFWRMWEKGMVTARTDEQDVSIQSKVSYDSWKKYETEDRGDAITIFLWLY